MVLEEEGRREGVNYAGEESGLGPLSLIIRFLGSCTFLRQVSLNNLDKHRGPAVLFVCIGS